MQSCVRGWIEIVEARKCGVGPRADRREGLPVERSRLDVVISRQDEVTGRSRFVASLGGLFLELERRGNLRQHVLYPVTGTGRVATVTRLLKLASVPDGVDAVVVMIQVPSLRRTVQA